MHAKPALALVKDPPQPSTPDRNPDPSKDSHLELGLPSLSDIVLDMCNLDRYRPTILVHNEEAGWEVIIGQLRHNPDLDIEQLTPVSEGGMGWVFEGIQRNLNRRVALKISKFDSNDPLGDLFNCEARETAALNHPNIPQIYALGKLANGHPYYLMEYVDGPSLETLRRQEFAKVPNVSQAGTLGFDYDRSTTILKYLRDAALALHHAHQYGVYHRDIKPENLKVDLRRGVVKVLDWGLLKSDTRSSTLEGARIGTLEYMAPEQARGQSCLVDARSDCWGVGATLYALVCGRSPLAHHGTPDKQLAALLDDSRLPYLPPREVNPEIPLELERIVLRALHVNREERYQSALLLANDLTMYIDGKPEQGERNSASKKLQEEAHSVLNFSTLPSMRRFRFGVVSIAMLWIGSGAEHFSAKESPSAATVQKIHQKKSCSVNIGAKTTSGR